MQSLRQQKFQENEDAKNAKLQELAQLDLAIRDKIRFKKTNSMSQ